MLAQGSWGEPSIGVGREPLEEIVVLVLKDRGFRQILPVILCITAGYIHHEANSYWSYKRTQCYAPQLFLFVKPIHDGYIYIYIWLVVWNSHLARTYQEFGRSSLIGLVFIHLSSHVSILHGFRFCWKWYEVSPHWETYGVRPCT